MAQNNSFSIPHLIIKKRDRQELTRDEIEFFVNGVVSGSVQPAQIGAMLMAMVLNHLSDTETTSLTWAMMNSGKVLEWPDEWQGKLVDKHSTGGVGDKISLVLAPALASCGLKVPMVSGRGLAHTGGTLDKLESIPGFSVNFNNEGMQKVMADAGCCIVGQTGNLVPADKVLYSTRDVTGTVNSVGLISSSIMSKKAAEKIGALVLDVKIGVGSSTSSESESKELAKRMVNIGNGLGIGTVAVLTSMNTPLGRCVGNALEVAESIDCLNGKGPRDVMELVLILGGHLLNICKAAPSIKEGSAMLQKKIDNGEALQTFCKMMIGQGVEPGTAQQLCKPGADVWAILPKAKHISPIKSEKEGYIKDINAMTCAVVSGKLGAGRSSSDDSIKFGVGLVLDVEVGDKIAKGDTWIHVHHDNDTLPEDLLTDLQSALVITDEKQEKLQSRVIDVIAS